MDTKTVRRNFYQQKSYLSHKYDEVYNPEKFSQELQSLLDEFIPNATLKQLTKFMEKKYHRILKSYPAVEKALKKVIKEKINKIPSELRQIQRQKLFKFSKEFYTEAELIPSEDGHFKLTPKDKQQIHGYILTTPFQGLSIERYQNNHFGFMNIDRSQENVVEKPFYKITFQSGENSEVKVFASTTVLQQEKFGVIRGNFDREANRMLQKFNDFVQLAETIENTD